MERFNACVDRMVAEGVAVYIELLCYGERERSKQLLRDLMQVSSLVAGGPSSKLENAGGQSIGWALIYFTLRSILSSLLVLRATRYWARIPRLANLQTCCRLVADIVEEVREGRDGDAGSDGMCSTTNGGHEPHPPAGSLAVAETH